MWFILNLTFLNYMNSAEQIPSGAAKNCCASQAIPQISRNPKVYHQAYEAISDINLVP
jgi:hypothetical protein